MSQTRGCRQQLDWRRKRPGGPTHGILLRLSSFNGHLRPDLAVVKDTRNCKGEGHDQQDWENEHLPDGRRSTAGLLRRRAILAERPFGNRPISLAIGLLERFLIRIAGHTIPVRILH
jgi:hypothetical protein